MRICTFTDDSAMADTFNFSILALEVVLDKHSVAGGLWLLSDSQISVCDLCDYYS